jgi:ABC-type Fe3+-siderophore transport system permease subunit
MVWLACGVVLALALVSSFRLPLAQDPGGLLAINGPRVLLGAGAGALAALAGALRQLGGSERPLRELRLFAGGVGAAAGGFLGASLAPGAPFAAFAAGALVGAGLGDGVVRLLDRPARWTNLGAALLLPAGVGLAAVAGSYARDGDPRVARAVTWLLGDLSGASIASGAALTGAAVLLCVLALRALARGSSAAAPGRDNEPGSHASLVGPLAFGVSLGAVGPLAFVGSLAPRAVRALAPGASAGAVAAASAAAGAATVVAVDAVPRLLVGGYDFPWNVPAGILAFPIFLGWNRARLRREAGRAGLAFEALELALIAALTLGATILALFFTQVVRSAT